MDFSLIVIAAAVICWFANRGGLLANMFLCIACTYRVIVMLRKRGKGNGNGGN